MMSVSYTHLLWTMGYGMVSGSNSPRAIARSLLHTPVLYAMEIGRAHV